MGHEDIVLESMRLGGWDIEKHNHLIGKPCELGCKEASFHQGLWWSKIPRRYERGLEDNPIDQVRGITGCEGSLNPGASRVVNKTV